MPMKVSVYVVLEYDSETGGRRSIKVFSDEPEATKHLEHKRRETAVDDYKWGYQMFTGEVELGARR